jgi:hypothetical protein
MLIGASGAVENWTEETLSVVSGTPDLNFKRNYREASDYCIKNACDKVSDLTTQGRHRQASDRDKESCNKESGFKSYKKDFDNQVTAAAGSTTKAQGSDESWEGVQSSAEQDNGIEQEEDAKQQPRRTVLTTNSMWRWKIQKNRASYQIWNQEGQMKRPVISFYCLESIVQADIAQ